MSRFAAPYLLFLLIIPIGYLIMYYFFKFIKPSTLAYSDTKLLIKSKLTWRIILYRALPILTAAGLSLAIIAAARPQAGHGEQEVFTEGIDIMLVLDISTSMMAEDFKPDNRLVVSKNVIRNFIKGRQGDRIGLVVFARQAFTQCPLTTDYNLLIEYLDQVDFNMVDDGTAIGLALAIAANHIQESDAESKMIVLLTDGVNNAGQIDPITAAKAIAALDIKTYTIGAGKQGLVDYPVHSPIFGKQYRKIKSEIDEETLKEVAGITNGRFFRATNSDALQEIYDEISEMEQTQIEVKEYYRYEEMYSGFLSWGIVLIGLALVLGSTIIRSVP